MSPISKQNWGVLDHWSGRAFLIAGGLWTIDSGVNALELFLDMSVPSIVFLVLILSSLLMTVVGALGFYPELAEDGSRLGLVGTIFVGLAGFVTTVQLAWGVLASLLNQPLPPGGILVVIVVLMVVGMSSFGIASVRTAVPPKPVGLLVLALVTAWVVWLAGVAGVLGEIPEWSSTAFGVVLAVLTLAIGYRLQTGDAQPGPTPTADIG